MEEHANTCSLTRTKPHSEILFITAPKHEFSCSRAWKGGGCTSITLHGRTAPSPLETRLLLVRNKPPMRVLCGGDGIRRREHQKNRERHLRGFLDKAFIGLYNPTHLFFSRLRAALHLASAGRNYAFCKQASCVSEKIQTKAEASSGAESSSAFLFFFDLISRQMWF